MNQKKSYSKEGILKALGPGILYAGAAIGASHIVMSTRAGADYGFTLLWAVVLINLFKYPFFEFCYRYTATTGKDMLNAYKELGNWAIGLFFLLSLLTGIVNFAAVTAVTAGLMQYLFGIDLDTFWTSLILLSAILLLMFIGKYAFLDKVMKLMIIVLTLATIIAFFVALSKGSQAADGFLPPEVWNAAGIGFLIAFMGWMPTPIEASVWPTLWSIERIKQTNYRPKFKEALVDFHIGYICSAVIAIFFLGLGALVMYGTGQEFSANGLEFSKQVVSLYTKTLGSWSHIIVASIVLITMFSTMLTVIDGYPRSLQVSINQLFPSTEKIARNILWLFSILLSFFAMVILGKFAKDMKSLLDFATILSFLAAPLFAFINYRVVTKILPKASQPRPWLKILAILGLIFLMGFCVLFIFSRLEFFK